MRVSFQTGAPEDVDRVICCLLIDWVGEVDGVGVLHPPVSPNQHPAKRQQTHGNCETDRRFIHTADRSVSDVCFMTVDLLTYWKGDIQDRGMLGRAGNRLMFCINSCKEADRW